MIKHIVNRINKLEEKYISYTDIELQNKTLEFKQILKNKEKTLEDILPEAFAVVREAAKRETGKRLYNVQLAGGYILVNGGIAEIKAGEGKSLIASLPAYLNALEGKGVHIVTTNEYLAGRDYEEIGRIFKFLGLSVGLIYQNMKLEDRKEAYKKDITYGTNTEFGFDYLRDNLSYSLDNMVQRELSYVLIDEVDSVLLDEAQTPMIISRNLNSDFEEPYLKANDFVEQLNGITVIKEDAKDRKQARAIEEYDYVVDLTYKTVELTQKGIKKAEKEYKLENLYDSQNLGIINDIRQALRAKEVLKKDTDYILKNDNIYIIDKFTGRIMYGKKFTNGLHQAIEAKEHIKISKPSKVLASISTQNYFKMYRKVAGMTGTAKSSEKEFNEIYHLNVTKIKTNKKVKRKDKKDRIFLNETQKYNAVIQEIEKCKQNKQPILIGTTSIEKSEKISKMLCGRKIKHNVLNAKKHKEEAEIVKKAGNLGKITIATNMAGRGTNILLGGMHSNIDKKNQVIKAGGLKVIGTEKHESRRIDEQLRGRSGRQGEIGESVFYISLEDELLKIYGNKKKIEKYKRKYKKKKEIKNIFVNREIKKAQKRAEKRGYNIRKRVVYYDDILSVQRKLIYEDRKKIVENKQEVMEKFIQYFCEYIVQDKSNKAEKIKNKIEEVENIKINNENIEKLKNIIYLRYLEKKKQIGESKFKELETEKMLQIIDKKWIEYLEEMEDIKQGIELQMYGRYNPIERYRIKAKEEFDKKIKSIKLDIVMQLLFATSYD